MNTMTRILLTTLICFTLIGVGGLGLAGQVKYTAGDGIFAPSESAAKKANWLYQRGSYRSVESLKAIGTIKIPPQGTPVEIQSYHNGIYRVRIPGSQVDWYVSEEKIINQPTPYFGGRNR